MLWYMPCAVKRVYRKLSEGSGDFTLSRNCMDVCKEDDETTCCMTDLCNGAIAKASSSSTCLRLILAVAVSLCVCLHRCVCLYAC